MKNFLLLLCLVLISQQVHAQVAIQTCTEVATSTTPTIGMVADQARKYLLVQNKSASAVIMKFDSAHVATEGIEIPAAGNYEPYKAPINSFYLKMASGTGSVLVCGGR